MKRQSNTIKIFIIAFVILILNLTSGLFTGCATVKNDYEQAKSADTYWAYSHFLSKYRDSEFFIDVASRMDETLWRETTKRGGIDQYRNYLTKMPNGKHIKEAMSKIDILEKDALEKEKKQKAFDAEMEQAKTISELEVLLRKYVDLDVAGKALARVEDLMIAEIDSKGPGGQYVIKDLKPAIGPGGGVRETGRVTLKIRGQYVEFNMQTQKDRAPFVGMGMVLPMGPGSVHRFDGSVVFKPYPEGGLLFLKTNEPEIAWYKFIGKGDQYHRLTFYLTKEYGYVYLRGKGEVIPKRGGEATRLGD